MQLKNWFGTMFGTKFFNDEKSTLFFNTDSFDTHFFTRNSKKSRKNKYEEIKVLKNSLFEKISIKNQV